jgi:taurine dioxygenase
MAQVNTMDMTMNSATQRVTDTAELSCSVEPLGPVMGAAIRGLDISQPLPPDTVAALKALFLEYKLLCFRDQDVSLDAQVEFTKLWGVPLEHTMDGHKRAGAHNDVQIASNRGPDGQPTGKHPDVTAMRWHTDRSWRPEPALATLLYGLEVPSTGGDTLYCNTTMAYHTLSKTMKQKIDPLRVIHSVEYSRRAAGGPPATEYELRIGPPTAHPLARKHPETGKRGIFLGSHAWKVEGMDEGPGRALIEELMAFATQDAFVYRHKWQRHDFVIWDNRCTLHAATPYDTFKELRVMHRTVVQGGPTS